MIDLYADICKTAKVLMVSAPFALHERIRTVLKSPTDGAMRFMLADKEGSYGEKGEAPVGQYDGYDVLLFEIVKMFRTGQVPVPPEETLELYAFMEAADESKRRGGAEVTLQEVLQKARAEVKAKP